MRFELLVAIRYFRSGGIQSVLTVLGVAVGVTFSIFIASLIGGVQEGLIQRIIGSLSQVTIEPKENDPRSLEELVPHVPSNALYLSRIEKFGLKEQRIEQWKPLLDLIEHTPGISAASPVCDGPGFALRGNQIKPVALHGVLPERANKIVDLKARLVQGLYDVSGENCVIGVDLAKDLGVRLKDKIHIVSGKNRQMTFTIVGIYDVGIVEANQRTFYLSLNNAQRLLDLVGYITAIETKVSDVFQANTIADRLAVATGLETKSWMRQNKEFLSAFQGQNAMNFLIRFFMMVTVAFGIAAVLIVSVVQKSREIGILKGMGARTENITRIFLFQGLFVGLIGSLIGSALGGALCWLMAQIPGDNLVSAGHLFPIHLRFAYLAQSVGAAMLVGVLAAIAPARRAAKLNPVEVIRYG